MPDTSSANRSEVKTQRQNSNTNERTRPYRPVPPPFGYYGAKRRISKLIVGSLPPHNAWVEAFCGSAAITLAKAPAPIEIINDLDGHIVNLFTQLRNSPVELCRRVSLTPYARQEHQQSASYTSEHDPLERARLFLVNTMMTVNGTPQGSSKQAGFSFSQSYVRSGSEARVSRWYNLPPKLLLVAERLRRVRIENRDARDVMKMFRNRPATLIYLDPPYLAHRGHQYRLDQDQDFHLELLDLCNRSQSMILVSSYDHPLYSKELSPRRGWTRQVVEVKTRDTTGRDFSRHEILWRNRSFETARLENRVPISLTTKETKENKLNPERSLEED